MSKRIKEELSKETLTKTTSESVEHSKSTKSRSHHSSQQNQNFFSNFCQFHFILFLIWLSGVVFLLWWGDFLPLFSTTKQKIASSQTKSLHHTPPNTSPAKQGRYTPEELAQYDGRDPSKPLLLSIMGRVYDVTKGYDKYGPGKSYHFFTGKDATRSFITGCFNDECFAKQPKGLEGLSASDIQTLKDWVAFYDSTYTYVGELVEETKKEPSH